MEVAAICKIVCAKAYTGLVHMLMPFWLRIVCATNSFDRNHVVIIIS